MFFPFNKIEFYEYLRVSKNWSLSLFLLLDWEGSDDSLTTLGNEIGLFNFQELYPTHLSAYFVRR